jgi:hypothetical protein
MQSAHVGWVSIAQDGEDGDDSNKKTHLQLQYVIWRECPHCKVVMKGNVQSELHDCPNGTDNGASSAADVVYHKAGCVLRETKFAFILCVNMSFARI